MNITGRLTADAKVSKTTKGKEVVNFSIAVNDSYKKDGQRVEHTAYFDCAYWRTTKAVAWLQKGLLVELTGQISVRAWNSKDGTAKAGINFYTVTIKPLARSAKNNDSVQDSTESKNGRTVTGQDEDDLPF
ncbi:single-strand DNA-binding protein [Chryseobacterium rhizosphaerae]|uniref:single-stranded DNA-binding protein n=1 Tax=Chryseobacterium rhizosphaerae TaxID=395937 RepID=UPI002864D33C|nr:single-stranded DNA-binding protein [Chryseobacterium rhizosphaerae]MDR6546456.1 single-strand DNA-binding protein [Chryseobacterium rhizosphaerae]